MCVYGKSRLNQEVGLNCTIFATVTTTITMFSGTTAYKLKHNNDPII